jgi:ABC-type cobalamin/Fe3+-siderophores transport system ATPase subunit
MKVFRIGIRNILGLESLEIKPGSWTEISGQNGSGKTSCLDAIRAALGTGHDATLLRQGASEGEVVLVLDDGTEIKRRITEDKSDVSVSLPNIGKISKPATYIRKLADALSLNPIQFLTSAKKDRVDQLLQAIPMHITADQIGFVPRAALDGVDLDEHALPVLGKIYNNIYEFRTGINREEKSKRATVAQLAETLPADAPDGDWQTSHDQIVENMRYLQAETSRRVAAVKSSAAEEIESLRKKHQEHKDAVNAELDAAIERLRADAQIEIQRSEKERDQAIANICDKRDNFLSNLEADYRPKYKDLSEALAKAKAMIEQHAKAESTRQFIATLTKEADVLERQATEFTHALGRLEMLKASLLERLPIDGLEVRDGDIYVGGIPFDRINTSKRVRLAIEVARLRAGNLGLVCVDGLECLDEKTFAEFRKAAAKSQLQFVVSKVASGPLQIETEVA